MDDKNLNCVFIAANLCSERSLFVRKLRSLPFCLYRADRTYAHGRRERGSVILY